MKKNLLTIIAIVLCIASQAQTEPETKSSDKNIQTIQTLFKKNMPIGWWAAPEFGWTKIDGKSAYLGGGSGGIIVDHSFSIGLAGYGIMNSQNFQYSGILDTADVYLYGGYGGLKLEYRLYPLKIVNVAFPLLIGGGGVTYSTWGMDDMHNGNYYGDYHYPYIYDGFFVIEPGVMVGVNLLKFMRLDAGVSYRFAPGIDLPETNSNLLNTFNGNISLKFGKF